MDEYVEYNTTTKQCSINLNPGVIAERHFILDMFTKGRSSWPGNTGSVSTVAQPQPKVPKNCGIKLNARVKIVMIDVTPLSGLATFIQTLRNTNLRLDASALVHSMVC